MTNNELSLDQLAAIAGGKQFPLDEKKYPLDEFVEWIKRPWCFPFPTDNSWPGEWPGQNENAQ